MFAKKNTLLSLRLVLVGIMLASLVTIFTPAKVLAADWRWIDRATILSDTGDRFFNANPFDENEYLGAYVQGTGGQWHCPDRLVPHFNGTATLIPVTRTSTGQCNDGAARTITIPNSDAQNITAYRIDENTIFMPACLSQGDGAAAPRTNCVFRRFEAGTPRYDQRLFIGVGGSNAKERYNNFHFGDQEGVDENVSGEYIWLDENNIASGEQAWRSCGGLFPNCSIQRKRITLADGGRRTIPDPAADYPVGADGAVDPGRVDGPVTTEEQPTCESANRGPLGWILCATLNVIDGAITGLESAVVSMLNLPEDYYKHPDMQRAWSYFRNIATFMLLIIGLVMVIGQAIGKD